MVIDLKLAAVNPLMRQVEITAISATPGAHLAAGSPLLDFRVDLSDAAPHDCPPVSNYRLTLREALWLRDLKVAVGEEVKIGHTLALFTQEADEALSAPSARTARISTTGILAEPDWWDEPTGV